MVSDLYCDMRLVRIERAGASPEWAIEAVMSTDHVLAAIGMGVAEYKELQRFDSREKALESLERYASDGTILEVRTVEVVARLTMDAQKVKG